MAERALFFGPLLLSRIKGDKIAQESIRVSLARDQWRGSVSGRYREPIKRVEETVDDIFQRLLAEESTEITELEELMIRHIQHVIALKGRAVMLDYGGANAESARLIAGKLQDDIKNGRLLVIATSLSPVPHWQENDSVYYFSGDVNDLLKLSADSEFNLRGAVDVLVSQKALPHSDVPGLALTQLAQFVSPEGLFIIDNLPEKDPLYKSPNDNVFGEKYKSAREQDWQNAIVYNLPILGLRAITQPRESYNYQIFAGLNAPSHMFS